MTSPSQPLLATWREWALRVAADGSVEFGPVAGGEVVARGALKPVGDAVTGLQSLRLEPAKNGLPFDLAPPEWWPEFAAELPIWIEPDAGVVRLGEPNADPGQACLWTIEGAEAAAANEPLPAELVGCWRCHGHDDSAVRVVADSSENSGFATEGVATHTQRALVVWPDGRLLELYERSTGDRSASRTAAGWVRPTPSGDGYAVLGHEERTVSVPRPLASWFFYGGDEKTGWLRRGPSGLTLLDAEAAGAFVRGPIWWAPPAEVRESR